MDSQTKLEPLEDKQDRTLGKRKHRKKIGPTILDLQEMECNDVDWIKQAQPEQHPKTGSLNKWGGGEFIKILGNF